MNLYATLGSSVGTDEAASLGARLSAWHDEMVAHERRIATGSTADVCDDECPHAEAKVLWSEAEAMFGSRADELLFLRSRGHDRSSREKAGARVRRHRAGITGSERVHA
jgi:hypothetical protein